MAFAGSSYALTRTPQDLGLGAAGLGLLSHIIFKTFEPSVFGFLSWLGALSTAICYLTNKNADTLSLGTLSVLPTVLFMTVYLAALSLSIGVYRLFLNPLRHFPGDTLPALTKWQSFYIAKEGKVHHYLWAQHKKYGDYIRVGPNEISVADASALPVIHGALSKFNKGPWYWKNSNEAEPGLFSLLDYNKHKQRRKAWDAAFQPKALKTYEPRMLQALDALCNKLDGFAEKGELVNLGDWIEYFAFDIMGDLGFGTSFHMLESGESHHYVEFVHVAFKYISSLGNVSWIIPLAGLVPLDQKTKQQFATFFNFSRKQFLARREQGPVKRDVFGFLLAAKEEGSDYQLTDAELESDARAVILGGGDTTAVLQSYVTETASTFAFFGSTNRPTNRTIFFYLTRYPKAYANLKKEVQGLFKDGKYDAAHLGDPSRAPYLNACINEALRLIPPGPNGMQRVVNTPGGIVLDDKWIPEGTKISVHGWSVMHDPRYFAQPLEFIPERWIEDSGFKGVHNKAAFIPFSQGVYQCAGRKLALQEARMFTVRMLQKYDFKIAPDFDPKAYIDRTESYLSITKEPLPMYISKSAAS
ncbi:MAG: hypothetical protein M1819_006485 [Sarea resinae]|nr:MAG: hypothetical protein M1819_006485 [Sarea resinae]